MPGVDRMSFFIKDRKRKPEKNQTRVGIKIRNQNKKDDVLSSGKRSKLMDEEIESSSDEDSENEGYKSKNDVTYTSGDESEEETAQEKKLRLVKKYLSQLEDEESSKREDKEIHKDIISHRLKQDLLEQTGKLQKQVADDYIQPTEDNILVLRGHKLPVTCLVISPDDRYIFSGSKDCSVIKLTKENGHTTHVLCLAISSDGKYLASGGRDMSIHIWNPDTCEKIHTFMGHRDTVSGLAFRKDSHQLFSASHDRSVKIWNLDEMSYVETFGSIDCVSLINESNFVSGADDKSLKAQIALSTLLKLNKFLHLHFVHDCIVELKLLMYMYVDNYDEFIFLSAGSKDGCIRLWKCCNDFKHLQPLFTIPITGFVNSMQFSKSGSFLVAGVGQEHKLGRWWRLKEAKNSICIISLQKKNEIK
ncbi:hypothetical protein KUTeg_023369 [Tegillarca granosa]|uniref:U3 small nucleolar RNA-interacting protein 2 n=1 Tax=Tegillarca granosa TaxID=220873 RepID=A0ABQ9E4X7_TEGGR|nr:hypothetical protein KUTeg_023369 [Tegillarca granosa]